MKKVAFYSKYDSGWIGGVYYIRNMAFQLNQCGNNKEFEIYIIENKYSHEFSSLNGIEVYALGNGKILRAMKKWIFLKKHKIEYLYPVNEWDEFGIWSGMFKCISWYPDFQHIHYPNYFTKEEFEGREKLCRQLAASKQPIVLSSHDAKNDFKRYHPNLKNIYVVPFVSYIEPELRSITHELELQVLNKYDLNLQSYICISNQFWQHKNHVVVLKAIEALNLKYPDFNYKFVFTGEPRDYRNPDYFGQLMELFNKPAVKQMTNILGFIDRTEQLVVMKNSKFIIQPSLFEGWGTVVEDAKVLDKLILLSDIPVHHEQMNENCVLFNPNDPEELADKIVEMSKIVHVDDIEKGIKDMYTRAKEYSKEFRQLLEDYK